MTSRSNRRRVVAIVLSVLSGVLAAFWALVASLTGGVMIAAIFGKGSGDRVGMAISGVALLVVAVGLLAVPLVGGLALVRRQRLGWAIALAIAWIPAAPLVLTAYLAFTAR